MATRPAAPLSNMCSKSNAGCPHFSRSRIGLWVTPSMWYVLSVPPRMAGGESARASARARSAADAAARSAGVQLRELAGIPALRAATELLAEVYRPIDPLPFEMLRAMQHAGNYVGGAYSGSNLIGAAAGLLASDGSLHSHILAVLPASRGRRIGFAVKLHQRAWALDRGITTVTWTFDPLVRRNAHVNLVTLGARADSYIEDFYGPMADDLNAGGPSDRLIVSWPLADDEVASAVEGARPTVPEPGNDTVVLLSAGPGGGPATAPAPALTPRPASGGQNTSGPDGRPARLAVGTPADITALRLRRPELATAWRYAQRETLGRALAAGYRVTGLTASGRYLLEAGE